MGVEMGAGDVGPVWIIVYLCLRSGKAEEAAVFMRETIGNNEIAGILQAYAISGGILPYDVECKFRSEYKRTVRPSSHDPFQRLIYLIYCSKYWIYNK